MVKVTVSVSRFNIYSLHSLIGLGLCADSYNDYARMTAVSPIGLATALPYVVACNQA